MRLALHALFCNDRDFTDEGVRRRAQIENDLRNNERSAEFFRKLRLAVSDSDLKAPEIFSPDAYPDPNDVAEYLDCQLESSAAAKEYENACLRSPEMLAEVGDCYDILTNKAPLQLDPPKNCRRRLYSIALQEPEPVVDDYPTPEPDPAPRSEYSWNDSYDGSPTRYEKILDSERFVMESVEEEDASSGRSGAKRKGTKAGKSKEKSKTDSQSEKSGVGLGLKSILALFVVLGAARLTFNLRALNSESPASPASPDALVVEQATEQVKPTFDSTPTDPTATDFPQISDQLVSTEDEPREGEFSSSLPIISTPPELAAVPPEDRVPQPEPSRERREQIEIPDASVDAFTRGSVF